MRTYYLTLDYSYVDDEDSNLLNKSGEDDDPKSGLPRNPDRFMLSHTLQTSIMRPDFTQYVVNPDESEISGHNPEDRTKVMANENHDYFPQLSGQNDQVDISHLGGLKPNFTQMQKGNFYSTKPTAASRKPLQNQKQKIPQLQPTIPSHQQQNSFDRPGMLIQELMDDFDKFQSDKGIGNQELDEKSDRFAADILSPAQGKPKMPNRNDFAWIPRLLRA